MLSSVVSSLLLLSLIVKSEDDTEKAADEQLLQEMFPHYEFECDIGGYSYETSFTFLKGLGRGFVHAEAYRVYFEYYFPAEHWVGFAAADQSIEDVTDHCTQCYFNNYYNTPSSTNHSNLYPKCIEECLDDTIFVATVNSDEENLNDWNIIEFQIIAQNSKKLEKKMYRIPKPEEILELWGSQLFPYREGAHFESSIYTIPDGTKYVHAKFWRRYGFAPDESIDEYDETNEWKPFTTSPDGQDLYYDDSLCFISIASYFGGEYPYDIDALENYLPGFYIDTEKLSNIHCYKLDDIKVDCGQDWSFLTLTKEQQAAEQQEKEDEIDEEEQELIEQEAEEIAKEEEDGEEEYTDYDSDNADFNVIDTDDELLEEIYDGDTNEYDSDIDTVNEEDETTTTSPPEIIQKKHEDEEYEETDEETPSPTAKVKKVKITTTSQSLTSSTKTETTMQEKHEEDCCSAISQISYNDINCFNISQSPTYVKQLEQRWKDEQCGRPDKLPTDLNEAVTDSEGFDDTDCDHLWAYFNQIHEYCYKFTITMGVYNHFITRGGYECYNKNTDECKAKEVELEKDFNNFSYDEDTNFVDNSSINTTTATKVKSEESELAEMEEDGGLTITSLGVLGLIVAALAFYVLYWFCCSNASRGYKQQMMYDGGYYDDDIDTDEYMTRKQVNRYNERINGGHNMYRDQEDDDEDEDSDWSVDEQLGVINDDHNQMEIDEHSAKTKKKKGKKNKKSKKKKKKNKEKNGGYDISVNDVNSMPINSDNLDDDEQDRNVDMNDAIEVRVDHNQNPDEDQSDDDDDVFEENETLQNEQEYDDDDDDK